MAAIRCRCGWKITVSGEIPNPLEWKIISDVQFDGFAGVVDAEEIYLAARSQFKCPVCGRLWVFWDGFDQDPSCYAPEGDD
ncbi:hypothetical protein [Actinomadura rayongensis]|uniref:Uncharacterized protein n=1 Tax=Actinomadura rayongensis TaxID=1429076 RepID=A0A6I4VYC2_9ACTN|nr:hypothetical protein [Actinomadura rayongensis]MXQ62957.1 hypothetical protein [Actinomadura rayongensis]